MGFHYGGGVYCFESSPKLTNCTISGNMAFSDGGGMRSYGRSSLTLTDCTIIGNKAHDYGGGIHLDNDQFSHPALTHCTLSGNTAHFGGGMYSHSCIPTITNCRISGNTASSSGGGLSCSNSNLAMTNCTISGNTAAFAGGLSCSNASPKLTNCTITCNTSSSGGGLSTSNGGPRLTNSILWGDTPQEIYHTGSYSPTVSYCDVQGGWSGTGNIDADPGFAFADDPHLMPDSPCIDAGTNSPTGGLPSQDADGNPRPLDGDGDSQAVADMGAYEFNASVPSIAAGPARIMFLVPEGQAGQEPKSLSIRNAGGATLHWTLSWDVPWLQADLVQGESTGEVNTVALTVDASDLSHGIYSAPLTVADPQACNNPRTVEVVLSVRGTLHVPSHYAKIQEAIDAAIIPGDEVLLADGTYTGSGNKDLDFHGQAIIVRSASGNPDDCIIDCQGDGRGFYFTSGEGSDSLVEDLAIHSAFSNGVYCAWSSPTLANCVITGNSTSLEGSGVYCYFSSPTLTNCTISGNSGSGVYCLNSCTPTLTNCTINDNYESGVYCEYSSNLTLTNCTIDGNMGFHYGGGVYCSSSSPTLINCSINGNSAYAGHAGGVFACDSSNPTLTNCTIAGNVGNGVHCSSSSLVLTNCVLWGNTPQEIIVDSGATMVTYCDVQGAWPGTGNINANPLFVDPDGPDNDPATWQDNDYHIRLRSPCVNAGDPNGNYSGQTDMDGEERVMGGRVDMGADEFLIGVEAPEPAPMPMPAKGGDISPRPRR